MALELLPVEPRDGLNSQLWSRQGCRAHPSRRAAFAPEVHTDTARADFSFSFNLPPLDLLCSHPPWILQLLGGSDTTISRLRSLVFMVSQHCQANTSSMCSTVEDPSDCA